MTDESMQSGRSVRLCASVTARTISSTSSASGAPMLTSSTMAPPATCSRTSISTRERSPRRSCSWNTLRPVGLMRSPMMQKGWSSPMTTSLAADRRTVCTGIARSGRRGSPPALQELLGLGDRGGGVGRVAVGPDGVGVLLGDRCPSDHHDDALSQPRLLEGVDVGLEHRHRRREEGREPDDVRRVLLDGGHELLRRYLHAEVDDVETGPLEHDVHEVLADVVDVALHRPHHEGPDGLDAGLGEERAEDLERPRHGLAGDEHLGDEEVPPLEACPDLLERGDERLEEQLLGRQPHAEPLVRELEHPGCVPDERLVVEHLEQLVAGHAAPSFRGLCPRILESADASATQAVATSLTWRGPSLLDGAETETAATAASPDPKTGAATAARPGSSSSSVVAKPCRRTTSSSLSSAARFVSVAAVRRSSLPAGSVVAPKARSTLPSALACSGTGRPTQLVAPSTYRLSTWAICSTTPRRVTPRFTVSPVTAPSRSRNGAATWARPESRPARPA